MRVRLPILAVALAVGLLAPPAAEATNITLSTGAVATLGGLTFRDGDIIKYDDVGDSSQLIFDEDNFAESENINALHVVDAQTIILSTSSGATLGGLTFRDGDLVQYDLNTDTATLFFDEDLFTGDEDIDAATVLSNGNIVLSTVLSSQLGGVNILDGDLVEYNPTLNTAVLFFSEALFGGAGGDIDAVHVLSNGNIVLSTTLNATLGGLNFVDGDLVEYNPSLNVATLFFDESLFGSDENINAVFIPEPTPALFMGLGFAGLGVLRRLRVRAAKASRS
jgi:hypothetical protein